MGVFSSAHPPATVIFADDAGWHSFDQVAATLRRRGLRTVRVTLRSQPGPLEVGHEPPFRWLANHLFYDETIVLSEAEGPERLERVLAEEPVADVIVTEPLLLALGLSSPLARKLTARSLAFREMDPDILLDKFAVNTRLAAAGVGIPQQARVAGLSPARAAKLLGLPLVLKNPIGAAGDGVRIAATAEAATRAIQELGGSSAPLFYQQHVEGAVLLYGAVVGPEGPMLEHGFRVEEAQYPLGPSAVVSIDDSADLLAAGRRAAELFGCHGFVSFGFLRSADGQLLHIDANWRVWGMMFSPARLGVDFTAPYIALVTKRPWRSPRPRALPAAQLPVLPFALYAAAAGGSLGAAAASTWAMLATFWTNAGPAYCLHAALCAGLITIRRMRKPAPRPARAAAATAADAAPSGSKTRRAPRSKPRHVASSTF